MKSFAVIALAATAALAQSPPAGCQASSSGTFNIQTVNVTSSQTKRDLKSRQLAGALTLSLKDGILKDQAGRQGYVAANYQFQFDAPLQAGALESTGFSICSNGTLALSGGNRPLGPAVWFQCFSGNFYNLYSQSTGAQCIPIYINTVPTSGSGASQISDGQPQVTTAPGVSQISDGQPQAGTPKPSVVSQISDGQPQAGTPSAGPVVTQISDGQPQAPTPVGPVVSQISDGQPQAPTPVGPVVSQISDGQPQAPTPVGPVVSQISDGQPQAPTPVGPVVSQISDGQPQAPTPVGPVVSQISDGQPQAPTPVGPVVSQISDGQPQAPVATGNATLVSATPSVAQYTGAAATSNAAAGAFVAGLFGLFAML